MRRKLAAMLLGLVGLGGAAKLAWSEPFLFGPCNSTIVGIAVDLCGSASQSLGGGVTQFTYNFAAFGLTDVPPVAAIPLLDANAIIPGTLQASGGQTPTLVTDPTQVDFWWNFTAVDPAKEVFETPEALVLINVITSRFLLFTVSFQSNNPVVDGPIRVDYLYSDPPLPGAAVVPEPATLALLGLGLVGLAAARRRRA